MKLESKPNNSYGSFNILQCIRGENRYIRDNFRNYLNSTTLIEIMSSCQERDPRFYVAVKYTYT